MTGTSLLQVERETKEGHKVIYGILLPWELRRCDYGEPPEITHQGRFFVVEDLLWKGQPAMCAMVPYGVIVPRSDWGLDDYPGLTTLDDARRLFQHTEDAELVTLQCTRRTSSTPPALDPALWLPEFIYGVVRLKE